MFAPYPAITVPADVLNGMCSALERMTKEFEGSHCGESSCGCSSSRTIIHAALVAKQIRALLDGARATQELERYVKNYVVFIDDELDGPRAKIFEGRLESATKVDAVDPHVESDGTPSTRVE